MIRQFVLKNQRRVPFGQFTASFSSSSAATVQQQQYSPPVNTILKFVPQQTSYVVERMGKFHKIMQPGLGLLIPIIDRIKYVHSLKEEAVNIQSQSAITKDNVTLAVDGVLFLKVVDPFKASYGVEDAKFAVIQLAQTAMRSEVGGMTLDRTLSERATLNKNIVEAINSAAADWGITCLRYEIRNIIPPESVVQAMHTQVSADRQKRAYILDSEGRRQAEINVAEGHKGAAILASEARKAEQVNLAAGEAEAILARAKATAVAIETLAESINKRGGSSAVGMAVAEKYIEAFSHVAKQSTTMLLPFKGAEPSSMIAQAMSIFGSVQNADKRRLSPNEKEDAQ